MFEREPATRLFEALFQELDGALCIVSFTIGTSTTVETKNFQWPFDLDAALEYVEYADAQQREIYFCAQLLESVFSKRRKVEIAPQVQALWADLDEASPERIVPAPSLVVRSSEDRYHAYWLLDEPISAEKAEDYSKRIAWANRELGVDQSGWDLTQLLRVPGTRNRKPRFKHKRDDARPLVEFVAESSPGTVYPTIEFDRLPVVLLDNSGVSVDPMPEIWPEDDNDTQEERRARIAMTTVLGSSDPTQRLMNDEADDKSRTLWALYNALMRIGMTPEQVFNLARKSVNNKFKGNDERLWADVQRAFAAPNKPKVVKPMFGENATQPDDKDDIEWYELPIVLNGNAPQAPAPTFVEKYCEWANAQTDAPMVYHESAAFMLLSAIIGGSIQLHASIGTIVPNLWMMILADSTLTRKSTTMRLAENLLKDSMPPDIDDPIVATDGTYEGIFKALSLRAGRPSLYFRDEVTGLMEQARKQEYMAGILEGMTKLYDGDSLKRTLSREQIIVKDPVFLFYAGGIKSRMEELLTRDHFLSGFIPRFIVISAMTDLERLASIGPPTVKATAVRGELRATLAELHERYAVTQDMVLPSGATTQITTKTTAILTEEAWKLQAEIEREYTLSAFTARDSSVMLPVVQRGVISQLKMALLLAATKQVPNENLQIAVEAEDIAHAHTYIARWLPNSIDLAQSVQGLSNTRRLNNLLNYMTEGRHSIPWIAQQLKLSIPEVVKGMQELKAVHNLVETGDGSNVWLIPKPPTNPNAQRFPS